MEKNSNYQRITHTTSAGLIYVTESRGKKWWTARKKRNKQQRISRRINRS